MSYSVNFLDVEKFLNSKFLTAKDNYNFSEIMASVIGGFAGSNVLTNSVNSVTFELIAGSVTTRVTTEGSGLLAEARGGGFVLRSGTVNKITYSADFGDGFFDAYEITDLNLSAISTFNTIVGFLDGSLTGDQVILAEEGVRYFGTDANDVFSRGTRGELREILTLKGDDYLQLGGGADRFDARQGNDTILGQAGNDRLYGGTGNDILNGGLGKDHLYGGDDNDRMKGGNGDDAIDGGKGKDIVYGGTGDDYVRGGGRGDKLFGQKGNDRIYGDNGNDTLMGGGGFDSLYGGSNGDVIIGGAGRDQLGGGGGHDVFVFNNASGKDVIHDYSARRDMLQIDTDNIIEFTVLDTGIRVYWGEGSVLVLGVFDFADLDFV